MTMASSPVRTCGALPPSSDMLTAPLNCLTGCPHATLTQPFPEQWAAPVHAHSGDTAPPLRVPTLPGFLTPSVGACVLLRHFRLPSLTAIVEVHG